MTDRHPGDILQIKKRMPAYFVQELNRANLVGDQKPSSPDHRLALPTVTGAAPCAGVRITVTCGENRLGHFRVPVVETANVSDTQRTALNYTTTPRTIPATTLQSWLAEIYPPAVMDGHGRMRSMTGDLTWQPAGSNSQYRFATLRGNVRFELDNRSRITYNGPVELVLRYHQDNDTVEAVWGVFNTRFPRQDQRGKAVEWVTLSATIESLPETKLPATTR